jgi:hypothetical protein
LEPPEGLSRVSLDLVAGLHRRWLQIALSMPMPLFRQEHACEQLKFLIYVFISDA